MAKETSPRDSKPASNARTRIGRLSTDVPFMDDLFLNTHFIPFKKVISISNAPK